MNAKQLMEIENVFKKLGDDYSRRLFLKRTELFLENIEWFEFTEDINVPNYDIFYELDGFAKGFENLPDIAIYGAGNLGEYTARTIKGSVKYSSKLKMIVDTHYEKKAEICGMVINEPRELLKLENAIVIISVASKEAIVDIYHNLINMGVSRNSILVPEYGFLVGYCSNQYFDTVKPKEKEVFIDAGFYNGDSSVDFVKWCEGGYDHIYAFEPYKEWAEYGIKRMKKVGISNFTMINAAACEFDGKVGFQKMHGAESHVTKDGTNMVDALSIDSMLKGQRATFIKMDLEGGEYNALLGARKTIEKYAPVLAISIYHKPDDFLVLALLILEINPNYKFYIRHYSSFSSETVLFAIIEGRDEIEISH